ncbi:MAG TPA: response regulator transcription factor [Chthoniobacterales bacterium]|jgi:DNA-binding NarL/FixJ family response regulator|nr:response regulator transcription factor [Chthoniobacterales bacterium]
MMTDRNLRILIADDYDIVREGARAIVQRHPGWEVCGIAKTGREAVELAVTVQPDVVVMDMSMPELNGLDAAIQIKQQVPSAEIVIFTAHENDDLIRAAFTAGAKSFISKLESQGLLVRAIESLARHQPFFTARVSAVLFSNIVDRAEGRGDSGETGHRLSAREREIVQLIAEGNSNKAVADMLRISIRTAEAHRAAILRKLHVDSVAGVVRYAIRNKMIEP